MSMGHSRGGKTALWHGAQDERVAIAYPLMSGCSGNGAIRVSTPHTPAGDGDSQSVRDINTGFPYCTQCNFQRLTACCCFLPVLATVMELTADLPGRCVAGFSSTYHNFSNGENAASDATSRAPWDQHFQRSLIAPRAHLGVHKYTRACL
jgi:hypothetical protein